jgi:5'-nucleotidase
MNSIAHYGLPIERAVFTSGRDRFRYAGAIGVDLFLSAHDEDVSAAIRHGIPAAARRPQDAIVARADLSEDEVRIALDGDSVIFSDEADKLYRREGLEAFRRSEEEMAHVPLQPGPFKPLLDKLHALRAAVGCKLRIALVTARGIPAHERALRTLLAWGIEIDELVLCAGVRKGPLLHAYGADLFFDDTRKHVDSANDCGIPAGHVPVGDGGIVTE